MRPFGTLVKERADAFLISPDALFVSRRVHQRARLHRDHAGGGSVHQLVTLAARHVLPALYHRREFAEAGGLMSWIEPY
jgi:hypothetical protein